MSNTINKLKRDELLNADLPNNFVLGVKKGKKGEDGDQPVPYPTSLFDDEPVYTIIELTGDNEVDKANLAEIRNDYILSKPHKAEEADAYNSNVDFLNDTLEKGLDVRLKDLASGKTKKRTMKP